MLRPLAGGTPSVQGEGETIRQVFDDLVARYPGLDGQIVTAEGQLHKFVNVYVNDDDVRYLDRLDTKLTASDVVSILPAVAGGA
jgi:molybdopterin converting factor small subunit